MKQVKSPIRAQASTQCLKNDGKVQFIWEVIVFVSKASKYFLMFFEQRYPEVARSLRSEEKNLKNVDFSL